MPQAEENHEGSKSRGGLKYGVDDHPPINVNVVLALQMVLSKFPGMVTITYMIRSEICAVHNNLVFAEMLSTTIFLVGLCTFMQVTIGVRLPILQGSAFSFLVPIISMMQSSQWKCPPTCLKVGEGNHSDSLNMTTSADGLAECDDEAWRPRLLEISGALVCASLVHCAIGLTGVMGRLKNYIGPLTIVPAVALVGLSLFPVSLRAMEHHWGIASLTLTFYTICALYLSRFDVPVPAWTSARSFHWIRFPIFKIFSVFLTMIFGWLLCLIFTVTGSLPSDPDHLSYSARVDARIDAIHSTKWIFVPYPGYWGTPTVSAGLFVGLLVIILQSVTESIGDYYATASVCNVPAPPAHAINRGLAVEGFGSILSGLLGSCHATTSYSGVVGLVAITGVGSRLTFQASAILFMLCGLLGKFGGAMAMLPDPVIGALSLMGMSMVTSVGLSSLRHCDMKSTRNMAVLGLSLILGLACPYYLTKNPGVISTGKTALDELLTVFLGTGMMVGTVVGFTLDNIIPGTREERGLVSLNDIGDHGDPGIDGGPASTYDLPYVSDWLNRHKIFTYMPFLPSYKDRSCLPRLRRRCCTKEVAVNEIESVNMEEHPLN